MLSAVVITALLAASVQARGVADLVAEGALTGRSPTRPTRQRVQRHVHEHTVASRQQPAIPLFQNQTAMAAWDAQANSACQAALAKLPQSTNPSGTCTCYNLPALNTQTGAFEADLRLYQLSTARGDFTGIPPNQIQVALTYSGASVSPVKPSVAPVNVSAAGPNGPIKLLQSYLFVGQVDADKMRGGLSMADVEAYVMPTVTLSAVNSVGKKVNTTISSNEAVFVTGVFSDAVVLSDTAKAQVAVDDVLRGLGNGTVAFVLPGVNLLIFPIGGIICGSWFLIGLAVIGFGFYERVQYRESYRRRAAYAQGAASKRI